jgi:hypothetical protein
MSSKKKKDRDKDKALQPRRQERRFIAQSANNAWLVRVLGGVGATALGAGAWGHFYGHAFEGDEALKPIPSYLIAGGAVLTGVAIWLGTSSDPPVRVGAPGIGVERGEVRRIPWHSVDEITWESGTLALVVNGKDESGTATTFKVPVKSHPEAVGWVVQEALERVPKAVDISDEVLGKLPAAGAHAGTKIEHEPLQVVGKKCAASGKTISYEPDARVCPRCERVYFKRSVPKKCKCGAVLAHLRAPSAELEETDETLDDDDENDEESDEAREDAES